MTEKEFYWQTDNPHVFLVGGREFNVIKKGYDYAKQVGNFMAWLGTYGGLALSRFDEARKGLGGEEEKNETSDLAFLGKAIGSIMDPDGVIELSAIVLGCDRDFAEENFDIGWMTEALETVWMQQPGVRASVKRYAGRFFGRLRQEKPGTSESASSTESALLTDGTTSKSIKASKNTESPGQETPSN